jgi:YVTN family beta-propeller protein
MPVDQIAPAARMVLVKTITGRLDEKSVVSSQTGLFFAQNMMYLHTMNVYDRNYHLVKIIPDAVNLASLGYPQYPGTYKGAPVEAAFTPNHKYVYVSNYSMYGAAPFTREGSDTCTLGEHYPDSFVYRVNLATLTIDQAIEVGAVPKFVAVTPNGKYLLVSNWCSYNESIIDTATGKIVTTIPLGPYPRGIAIDPVSGTAYVAVMGSTRIAAINLATFAVSWISNVGSAPRHLVMSADGHWLYATINGAGVVDKISLITRTVVARIATGRAPRSVTISPDGSYIYVVNYMSNTMSKVRTSDMHILQTVPTNPNPIGITYDNATHRVWVACYSGSIMVFQDGTPTG